MAPALKAAAEGALTGGALSVMGPASRPVRLTGASAMTYAQARLNGDDNTAAIAKATTMGGLSAMAPGGIAAKDILPNAWANRPTIKSALIPTQQGAVDYLQDQGADLPAGTVPETSFPGRRKTGEKLASGCVGSGGCQPQHRASAPAHRCRFSGAGLPSACNAAIRRAGHEKRARRVRSRA